MIDDWKDKAAVVKKSLRLHLYEALSVLPLDVRDTFMSHCILSGSSISSVYHGESVNDFDLKEDKLYISESQMLIIDRKILVLNQENGVVAPYRLDKFKNRGWKML